MIKIDEEQGGDLSGISMFNVVLTETKIADLKRHNLFSDGTLRRVIGIFTKVGIALFPVMVKEVDSPNA